MFAVLFEVQPKAERWDDYLALAASLKSDLEAIDGFIRVERFRAAYDHGLVLSYSLWRDERAVITWRRHGGHRAVQRMGRSEIFRDYRLRVCEVVAEPAPLGLMEIPAGEALQAPLPDMASFESLYNPGKRLLLGPGAKGLGLRLIRDYGMFARAEAPERQPPDFVI